jgi:hypothetical protein
VSAAHADKRNGCLLLLRGIGYSLGWCCLDPSLGRLLRGVWSGMMGVGGGVRAGGWGPHCGALCLRYPVDRGAAGACSAACGRGEGREHGKR